MTGRHARPRVSNGLWAAVWGVIAIGLVLDVCLWGSRAW